MERIDSIGLGFGRLLDGDRSKISATPKRARDVPYTRSRPELDQAPFAFAPIVRAPVNGDGNRHDPAVALTAVGFTPVGGVGHRHEASILAPGLPSPRSAE
jgi:hypothetical protein